MPANRPSVAECWVTQEEAVRLLGVSCSTVARWARAGRLPATRAIRGRRYDVGGVLEERAFAKVAADAAAREKQRDDPPAGWLLVADAAASIGISRNPLRRAIDAGDLEARRHRSRLIIREEQLQCWIEARRQERRHDGLAGQADTSCGPGGRMGEGLGG